MSNEDSNIARTISAVKETARLLLSQEDASELFWPFDFRPTTLRWVEKKTVKDAHRLAAAWARALCSGASGAAEVDRFGGSTQSIAQGGVFGADAVEEAEQLLDEVVGPEHLKRPAGRLKKEPAPTRLLVVAAYGWLLVEKPLLRLLVDEEK
jgi:hypothetical protein